MPLFRDFSEELASRYRFEIWVKAREFLGGGFAELADAHGEEPAVERFGFRVFERGEDLGGVLLAEAARGFVGAEVEVGECFLG